MASLHGAFQANATDRTACVLNLFVHDHDLVGDGGVFFWFQLTPTVRVRMRRCGPRASP